MPLPSYLPAQHPPCPLPQATTIGRGLPFWTMGARPRRHGMPPTTSGFCSFFFDSLCMHLSLSVGLKHPYCSSGSAPQELWSSLCQGEPLCATCAALHRLVILGTVLQLMVRRAQSFVTERVEGQDILTSAWTAPYFSPDSACCIHPSAGSSLLVHHLSLNQPAH